MLAALAAVWFLMFLPSWMSRSSEREKSREELAVVRQHQAEALARLSSSNQQRAAKYANRALLIKRGTLVFGVPAIAVMSWTLAILTTNPEVLIWTVASALVATAAILVNRIAHNAYLGALDSSLSIRSRAAQRRANVALPDRNQKSTETEKTADARDPRAWSAPGLPRPLYKGSDGAIEQVKFAEVVEIKSAGADEAESETEQFLAGAALDEILKRRRANG